MSINQKKEDLKQKCLDLFYRCCEIGLYKDAIESIVKYQQLDNIRQEEIEFIKKGFIEPNIPELRENIIFNSKLLNMKYDDNIRYYVIPTEIEKNFLSWIANLVK